MPKDIEDFMHLLSLGVPPLGQIRSWRQHTVLVLPPPPIQRPLTEPQAEFPSPSSSSREVLKVKHVQKQSAIERTALSQLAGMYPELETLEIKHGWVGSDVRYHKRSDGGGGWEKCAGDEGMNGKG
ncbi:hypothetical protein FA13DRAFT_1740514 [Coprinellus micaceus]|uniref:Uncharacterized protein n=1 Tax=Coprinellus micaceus TaxID=71717 RepID=A0A4Y7SML7_COPMI|nr:hypothetical protein FA13DRAFT_1740514 [Coprinellus micaceus]